MVMVFFQKLKYFLKTQEKTNFLGKHVIPQWPKLGRNVLPSLLQAKNSPVGLAIVKSFSMWTQNDHRTFLLDEKTYRWRGLHDVRDRPMKSAK